MGARGPTTWIVVLGSKVEPGGHASGAMRRRIAAALAAADERPDARFLVTGAVGRNPPSEARVMRDLLVAAGVAPGRVVLEESGTDTLSSLRACAALLRGEPGPVWLCSDAYHLPRCLAVWRALGLHAQGLPARGARRGVRQAWMLAREVAGLPWDVGLALLARARR